jgi:hypothetical protein
VAQFLYPAGLTPCTMRSVHCAAETIEACSRQRRERAHYDQRAFTTCAVSSWESEELDEHPHALFLTATRKSLGSC